MHSVAHLISLPGASSLVYRPPWEDARLVVFKDGPSNLGPRKKLWPAQRGISQADDRTFCSIQWRQANLGKVLCFSDPHFSPVSIGNVNEYSMATVRITLNDIHMSRGHLILLPKMCSMDQQHHLGGYQKCGLSGSTQTIRIRIYISTWSPGESYAH